MDNSAAVMVEGLANPVSLFQTFNIKAGTPTLYFTLQSLALAENQIPDAFQVSLVKSSPPGNSLVGAIPGGKFPEALLSFQQTGEIYYAPEVSIPGAPPSGSKWTPLPETIAVTVNLFGIAADVSATIAFDLINPGPSKTGSVRIDNVQTVAFPVAINDAIATDEDTPVSIPVLANDVDLDGLDGKPDPTTATLTVVTAPSQGTAAVQADGTILYTPAPNYAGTDSFTYTVKDNNGNLSNVATVTLTVTSVNDPPVADAGPDQSVKEGAVVTLDGSASTDVEGPIAAYLWEQVGGTPLVTLSSSGIAKPTFTAPNVGPDGALLTFRLTVTDGDQQPRHSSANVAIQINNYVIPCDVNDNGSVDIADAIVLLRVMSRLDTAGSIISLAADVNGDHQLGMPEVICVLQSVAGLRFIPSGH